MCEETPLECFLGARAFHDSQSTNILLGQMVQVEDVPHDDSKFKRSLSSDCSDDEICVQASGSISKRSRIHSFGVDVLDNSVSSCMISDNDDKETVYSMQGYVTERIADPSDTSSSCSVDLTYHVEFEVPDTDSDPDVMSSLQFNSGSSDDSNVEEYLLATTTSVCVVGGKMSDEGNWADSESDFELSNYDPELDTADNWSCLKCQMPNPARIRYCSRCWQERKDWLPAREKPRRKRRENKNSAKEAALRKRSSPSHESDFVVAVSCPSSSQKVSSHSAPSDGFGSNSNSEGGGKLDGPNLCTYCCIREKNASFIHGTIGHIACCYRCAKRLVKRQRRCPVCRRKIEKIVHNIFA